MTVRTQHSRLLLRPGVTFNEIFIGALARAQRRYGVAVVNFACISNHLHLQLIVDDALQLARFMGYFLSKLAKEVGRLTGWKKIFGRRYQHIVVSDEEAEQLKRFRDWPGAHCADALLTGGTLQGHWFDRTSEYSNGWSHQQAAHASSEGIKQGISLWASTKAFIAPRRIAE